MNEAVSDAERVTAAVAYVGPLWIFTRFLRSGSEFCRFHARQGCVLFWGECIAVMLTGIANGVVRRIPVFGSMIVAIAGFVIWTAAFIISFGGVANAAKWKTWRIPILGRYAETLRM